ncbi:hypothetical protein [Streptomyces justiciae]|uniref:Uncharacterized protein n=1 Tax=Streptomyces justiciae TaxID=2780140 RepID=A0ABU3M1W0_9ACTN|nr:hypothetical protein [Streptomyces justiciae]MDT7844939.1 hypothetical protein [Streptomyces justiciae]
MAKPVRPRDVFTVGLMVGLMLITLAAARAGRDPNDHERLDRQRGAAGCS